MCGGNKLLKNSDRPSVADFTNIAETQQEQIVL